ncbi:MAG: hypothetical protein WCP55_17560 [Lentisphaerota bacterium]
MKFIYLADTHIGASDDKGYRQQLRYVSRISELMDCLDRKYVQGRLCDRFIERRLK